MSFAEPLYLALTILVVPMLWLRRKRQSAVGHSQAETHKGMRSFFLFGWLPTIFLIAAWLALCAAMARPMLEEVTEKKSIQTRDFIVATDFSGSMWGMLQDPGQQNFAGGGTTGGAQPPQQLRRIDAARQAIKTFVASRQGDRVALFVFDTDTYPLWPLSEDLKVINDKADLIGRTMGGGTNFEGPSRGNPGYGPLQSAINHFVKYGKSTTKVLIMVTDGEDSISAERAAELTAMLEKLGIKLYVLGVGESWTNGNQVDLRTFTENLGGIVIPVGDAEQMRAGMNKIDQLEKSTVVLEKQVSHKPIYQVFLAASLAFWLLYLGTSALIRESA